MYDLIAFVNWLLIFDGKVSFNHFSFNQSFLHWPLFPFLHFFCVLIIGDLRNSLKQLWCLECWQGHYRNSQQSKHLGVQTTFGCLHSSSVKKGGCVWHTQATQTRKYQAGNSFPYNLSFVPWRSFWIALSQRCSKLPIELYHCHIPCPTCSSYCEECSECHQRRNPRLWPTDSLTHNCHGSDNRRRVSRFICTSVQLISNIQLVGSYCRYSQETNQCTKYGACKSIQCIDQWCIEKSICQEAQAWWSCHCWFIHFRYWLCHWNNLSLRVCILQDEIQLKRLPIRRCEHTSPKLGSECH